MSDLRFDQVNQLWVAIARNRLQRPTEYMPIERVQMQLLCPFCQGNEDETPLQLDAYGADGKRMGTTEEGWVTRVIPNKYPSFSDDDAPVETAGSNLTNRESGWQELIIPTSRHIESFSELTDTELEVTMVASQDRLASLKSRAGIEHGMLFMNCRSAAGASLSHIHLQLIGSPVMGTGLASRIERDEVAIGSTGITVIEGLVASEREQAIRMVTKSENFEVFCPFASRFPLQIYIAPKSPKGDFLAMEQPELGELGQLCRQMVRGLESILDQPAYNILLHTPPFEASEGARRGWFIEIFPRMTCPAGFEWGTGTWINPVSPEAAAKRLRACQDEIAR